MPPGPFFVFPPLPFFRFHPFFYILFSLFTEHPPSTEVRSPLLFLTQGRLMTFFVARLSPRVQPFLALVSLLPRSNFGWFLLRLNGLPHLFPYIPTGIARRPNPPIRKKNHVHFADWPVTPSLQVVLPPLNGLLDESAAKHIYFGSSSLRI